MVSILNTFRRGAQLPKRRGSANGLPLGQTPKEGVLQHPLIPPKSYPSGSSGAQSSQLSLLSIRPVRPYYSRNNRWFKTLTPASWCDKYGS